MKTQNMMSLLGGALVGAAAMYLLDPDVGARRRKYVKQQAGEYLGDAGERLQSGWENVAEGARDWGGTIAQKAQKYGHRLADQGQDIGSDVSETAGGWLSSGRKWLGGHLGKAQDYVPGNRQMARDLKDYSKGLWEKARGMGSRIQRSTSAEEHSAVLPVAVTALGCCALGAGLMFIIDPRLGRSRRSWLMDKANSIFRRTRRSFYRTGNDIANRAHGVAAETRGKWQSQDSSSRQLHERVRSAMGRALSHPKLVDVMAGTNGAITLSGCALSTEVDRVISTIESVPGVNLVINRLECVNTPEELDRRASSSQAQGVAQL
jgi:gas vesicle protein